MSTISLAVEELAFAYGPRPVFTETSFALAGGRYACLLGPSGSGKSTLLYVIAGLLRQAAGSIAIGGRIVADDATFVPPNERGLGMVFQDYSLWPHLTAAENVAFPLRARRAQGAAQTAAGLLERMGLEAFASRHPDELSGGQKQRVALARALAASPAVVLLDEPLSALDATVRIELREYLATLSRDFGLTALHVTHDPEEAFYLADVIGVMLGGRIVQWDEPAAVYRRPADARVAQITGPASLLGVTVESIEGGHATVTLAGHALRVPAHAAIRAPGAAALILRPDALRVDGDGTPILAEVELCRFAGAEYASDLVLRDGSRVRVTSAAPLRGEVTVMLEAQRGWVAPWGDES